MKTFTIPFFNKYRLYILAFLCVMPWYAAYFSWRKVVRHWEKERQQKEQHKSRNSLIRTETGVHLALTRSLCLSILIRLNPKQ